VPRYRYCKLGAVVCRPTTGRALFVRRHLDAPLGPLAELPSRIGKLQGPATQVISEPQKALSIAEAFLVACAQKVTAGRGEKSREQ